MSDRRRIIIGITAAAVSVAFCMAPALLKKTEKGVSFQPAGPGPERITLIRTEKNGEVNVNDADVEELTALHGVGESIASLIISERTENGPFYYAEDLESVRGIGPKSLEKFRRDIDLTVAESGE